MPYYFSIFWDDDGDRDGNVQHIAEHGLTPADIEFVLQHETSDAESVSSHRPCCFGYTPDGDFIIVIYEWMDEDTLYPVTAYEVDE